jgi:predicted O-linked N-acetylglucosamine transferase (SPINDLY family)
MSKNFQEELQGELFSAELQAKCKDGLALHQQGKVAEAERIYLEVLKSDPTNSLALHLLGIITIQRRRIDLRCLKDKLTICEKAIERKPYEADGYVNRAVLLEHLDRVEDAIANYERGIALNPNYEYLGGDLLFAKMQICDFSNREEEVSQLCEKIMRGERACRPFPTLAMFGSLQVQRTAIETWIRNRYPNSVSLPLIPRRPAHRKIRVGYFSADFCDHVVMHLIAELFERHTRSKFELTGFSFGPDNNDEMRRRVENSFDRFISVREQSDKDVALLSRRLEIDIAVD